MRLPSSSTSRVSYENHESNAPARSSLMIVWLMINFTKVIITNVPGKRREYDDEIPREENQTSECGHSAVTEQVKRENRKILI